MATVEPNDTVLLVLNDGDTLFVEIVPQRSVRVKKHDFSASLLIGAAFGSVWEVGSGARGSAPLTLVEDGVLIPGVGVGGGEEALLNDNRGYADTSSAQSLTAADISQMKKDGADGAAIVAALAKSSSTFADKNAMTQV